MSPVAFVFMTAWPILGLGMFIAAIVLSYKIEKRSPAIANTSGLPRYAMLFHTITNRGVARDEETQRLRRTMLRLLAGILVMFALVAIVVSFIERPSV